MSPNTKDEFVLRGGGNPITTGQGNGEVYGNWMARGLSSQLAAGRLGNKRGPTPTCSIPVLHISHAMVPPPEKPMEAVEEETKEVPPSAKVAATMLGEPCCEEIKCGMAGGPRKGELGHKQWPCSESVSVAAGSATGSFESSQAAVKVDHLVIKSEHPPSEYEVSDPPSDGSNDDDEDEMDYVPEEPPRKSGRAAPKRGRKGKEKKKVGRPIAYRGDPNSPELTDAEKRRIKRRIANRESARRVRHKRQEELEETQLKMEHLLGQNEQLRQHAEQIQEQKDRLLKDLRQLQQQHAAMSQNNKLLNAEIQSLRQSLQLKMSALEEELDKRANEVENGGTFQSAFGTSAAQSGNAFPPISQPLTAPRMEKQQSALDWFPSLNLDDPRAMEMLNCLLDESPSIPNPHAFQAPPATH